MPTDAATSSEWTVISIIRITRKSSRRRAQPRDQYRPVRRGVRKEHAQPVTGLDHPGEQGLRSGLGVGVAAGADVNALLVIDGGADPGNPCIVLVERDRRALARLSLDQAHACEGLAGEVSREPPDRPLGQRARLVPGGGHLRSA